MWQILFANLNELAIGGVYTWGVWFATRHTYGKWPHQWGMLGRPEKLGLNGYMKVK